LPILLIVCLCSHTSSTLPFENLKNIARIALNPAGSLLLSIDEGALVPSFGAFSRILFADGHALLINFLKRVALAEFRFKKPVRL
jgi:periodic tryptophan protein 2